MSACTKKESHTKYWKHGKTVQQQETTVVEEVGATVFPTTTDETYSKTQDMEPTAVQTTVIVISEVSIEKPYAKIQVTAETTVRTAAETTASVIPNK